MNFKKFMIFLGGVCLVAVLVFTWGCQNQPTGPELGNLPVDGKIRDTGSCSAGSFSISFNGSFVSGLGWSTGSSRSISWSGSCSNCNWGPGVYGWVTNPLQEYYVPRSAGNSVGSSYSCNGQSFTLRTNQQNNQPSIEGTKTFTQLFGAGGGGSPVDMGCHFSAWRSRMTIGSGQNYQVVAVENWSGGSGSASVSVPNSSWYTHWVGSGSATFTCGGGGGGGSTSTTTTSGGGGSTTTTSGGGGGGSGTVEVCFDNDDYNGRDLYIESVTVGGNSRGSATLYSNGCSSFGSSGGSIVIRARGKAGSEHMVLKIGGSTVADWTVSTSARDYTYGGGGGSTTTTSGGYTTTTASATTTTSSSSWWGGGSWWGSTTTSGGGGSTTTTAAATTTTSSSSWWGGGSWW